MHHPCYPLPHAEGAEALEDHQNDVHQTKWGCCVKKRGSSEVVIWLIWGIKVVFSTIFFVFSYFPVERIVFYFGLST
jgi:hypothetical protein